MARLLSAKLHASHGTEDGETVGGQRLIGLLRHGKCPVSREAAMLQATRKQAARLPKATNLTEARSFLVSFLVRFASHNHQHGWQRPDPRLAAISLGMDSLQVAQSAKTVILCTAILKTARLQAAIMSAENNTSCKTAKDETIGGV